MASIKRKNSRGYPGCNFLLDTRFCDNIVTLRENPDQVCYLHGGPHLSRTPEAAPLPPSPHASLWVGTGTTPEVALDRVRSVIRGTTFRLHEGRIAWLDGPSLVQVDAAVMQAKVRLADPDQPTLPHLHTEEALTPMLRVFSPLSYAIALLRHESDHTTPPALNSRIVGDLRRRLLVPNPHTAPRRPEILVRAQELVDLAGLDPDRSTSEAACLPLLVELLNTPAFATT